MSDQIPDTGLLAIRDHGDVTILAAILQELRTLAGESSGGTGIVIPPSDHVSYTYLNSTNNIGTAVFKTGGSGGTTVATLTYTYVNSAAADNDKIASITKS